MASWDDFGIRVQPEPALATSNFVVVSSKPSLESTQKWLQKRIDNGLLKKADPNDPHGGSRRRRRRKELEEQQEPLKGNGIGALLQMPAPPKEEVKPSAAKPELEEQPAIKKAAVQRPSAADRRPSKTEPSSPVEKQQKEESRRESQVSSHGTPMAGALLLEHDAVAMERHAENEEARQAAMKRMEADMMDLAGSVFGASGFSTNAISNARGWKILRDYMSEYMDNRSGVPDKVLRDVIKPVAKPNRYNGTAKLESAAAADRAFDNIIALATGPLDNPDAGGKKWSRAKQSYLDMRQAFLEMGYKPEKTAKDKEEPARRGSGGAAPGAPADQGGGLGSGLFPNQWWQTLGEELLAELVVDDFSDRLAEALLDSAVALVEEPLEEETELLELGDELGLTRPPKRAAMGCSLSAPDLRAGFAKELPESPSRRQFPMGPVGSPPPPPPNGGLTMKGQPMSWSTRRYHPCKQLEPIQTRIKADTESQRPLRQLPKPLAEDHRKFVWPMTAANFPQKWEDMTKPKQIAFRQPTGQPPPPDRGDEEPMISVDHNGKTKFPYSLALHKAFLDSQSDPLLKEKAAKLAPIRLTTRF